jgi:hypothetical protein
MKTSPNQIGKDLPAWEKSLPEKKSVELIPWVVPYHEYSS